VAATARAFRGVSALSRELGKASRLFRPRCRRACSRRGAIAKSLFHRTPASGSQPPYGGSRCSTYGSLSAGRMPDSIARRRSSSALNSAPSRSMMFEIHSHIRKMITPARAP
jgi:hypothetical protein